MHDAEMAIDLPRAVGGTTWSDMSSLVSLEQTYRLHDITELADGFIRPQQQRWMRRRRRGQRRGK